MNNDVFGAAQSQAANARQFSDPKPASQIDRITNAIQANGFALGDIQSRLYGAVARLLGEQPSDGQKASVRDVRSGSLGAIEDALQNEGIQVSQIDALLGRLEAAV